MKKIDKKIVVTASLLAAVTIILGAFGAHAIKEIVTSQSFVIFETGVRYQMYHVLALLVIGFANPITQKTKLWVFRFFIFGILFFSGSLYVLACKELLSIDVSFIGPITPIGGILFIIGWGMLIYNLLTIKGDK